MVLFIIKKRKRHENRKKKWKSKKISKSFEFTDNLKTIDFVWTIRNRSLINFLTDSIKISYDGETPSKQ